MNKLLFIIAITLCPAHAIYVRAANQLLINGWIFEYEIDDTNNRENQ